MRTLFALAAAALLTAALAPSPSAAADEHPGDAYSVPVRVTSGAPDGAVAYRVENPAGLRFMMTGNFTGWHGYDPLHIVFVNASGGVRHVWELNGDANGASWGNGDGVAYVGALEHNVFTPDALNRTTLHQLGEARLDMRATEGWFLVAWAHQRGPFDLRFFWSEGTTAEPVGAGDVTALWEKDLRTGARAGVPAAAMANVADGVALEPPEGGQLLGWVTFWRSDYGGVGRVALERGPDRREMDLTEVPLVSDPDDTCLCSPQYRWILTSEVPANVEYEFVGSGWDSGLYVFAVRLPQAVLPPVWEERVTVEGG